MKKLILLISIILIVISLTGCKSKKKTDTNNSDDTKITIKLGQETLTFQGENMSCGNYQVQSNVIFTNEKDVNGQYKGSYEFYECNDNNINLETAEGTYVTHDEEVIFTDTYGQNLTFEITDDNTIVQKDGSKTIRTFTK